MRRGGVLGFIIVSRRVEDYYFIYLFTHQSFSVRIFGSVGGCRQLFSFQLCGSRQVISGVRFSGSYYHAVIIIISTTLANYRRSFAVYQRGIFLGIISLPDFS